MDSFSSVEVALKAMLRAMADLRNLNVLTNQKDFTCQLGEWLVAMIYDGQRATNGIQKHWDVKIGNKHIQVKAHAKAETTPAQYSKINYESDAEIDELIIVVFTPNYKLKTFYKIPWQVALTRKGKTRKGEDSDVINWRQIRDYEIKISDLPKQDIITLFR